jgi:hypothetical protein
MERPVHVINDLGCSLDRFSADCPDYYRRRFNLILSAMARILFPSLVDMAYAASTHEVLTPNTPTMNAYYDHISSVCRQS